MKWISLFTCVSLTFILAESAPAYPRVLTYYKTEPALKVSSFSGFTCDICKGLFSLIRHWFDSGVGWDELAKLSVDICDLAKIEDHTVCQGIVWLFKVSLSLSQSFSISYLSLHSVLTEFASE